MKRINKLRIKPIAENVTELTYRRDDGEDISVLFSYETPVAGYDHNGAIRTDKHDSKSTTKHINDYFRGFTARVVPQQYIEGMVQ